VNGTLVAWPARRTSLPGGAVGSQRGSTVRSTRRNHRIVASRERGAAVSPCLALTGRPPGAVPVPTPECRWLQGVAQPEQRQADQDVRAAVTTPTRPAAADPVATWARPDPIGQGSLTERRYYPKRANHRLKLVGHAAQDASRDVPNGRGRRARSGGQSPGHVPGSGSSVLVEPL
jgi:hypothetical protein